MNLITEVHMAPRYRITLTKEERQELEVVSKTGKRAAKTILHARALLLLDSGRFGQHWTVKNVAEAVGLSTRSMEHLKQRFVEEGLEHALKRKVRMKPPREIIFDGAFEARLIALACSEPPDERDRWTVRLLAEKIVELKIAPTVSAMTVHSTLKKMNLSLT
jgi:hypothetical protein